jgi:hypothetical protein
MNTNNELINIRHMSAHRPRAVCTRLHEPIDHLRPIEGSSPTVLSNPPADKGQMKAPADRRKRALFSARPYQHPRPVPLSSYRLAIIHTKQKAFHVSQTLKDNASGRTRLKSSCCVVLVFRCVCLAIGGVHFSGFGVSAFGGAHPMLHQDSRLRIR